MNFHFLWFKISLFVNIAKVPKYFIRVQSDISNLAMSNLCSFQNTANCEQCIIQDYRGKSNIQSTLPICVYVYVCVCVYVCVIIRTTITPTAF